MPSDLLISVLLWIPFAIIVTISGLIFCISGYRKGLWRALLALAATIVAALVSLLLAKLISGAVAPAVITMVPMEQFTEMGLPNELMTQIVTGLVKMVISLALFPIFMFILTLVLRLVCDHFLKSKLSVTGKGMQWGGLAVGLVAAICYTLLMLLPIYGTCSAYIPTVESLVSLQNSEDTENEITEMLRTVSEHPVVKMSGSAPVAALYSSLASMDVGSTSLDIPKMSATIEKTLDALQDVMNASPDQIPERCERLITILRQEVVETDWFYSLAQDGIKEAREYLSTVDEDGIPLEYVNSLVDILDCPKEDFKANCAAILDFFAYVLKQDINAIAMSEDASALYTTGIIAEAGKLANFSKEAVAVKELLFTMLISNILDDDLGAAAKFLEKYDLAVTGTEAQEKEAESILLMMGLGWFSEAEVIMRHPALGEPAVLELIEMTDFATVMGLTSGYESAAAEKVNSDPALQQELLAQLRDHASRSLGDEEGFAGVLDELHILYPTEDHYMDDFSGSIVIGGDDNSFAVGGELPEGFYYDEDGNLYYQGELIGEAVGGNSGGISYGDGNGTGTIVIVRP